MNTVEGGATITEIGPVHSIEDYTYNLDTQQWGEVTYEFDLPQPSGWQCALFGDEMGIVYYPAEGQVPNRWIRFWTKVFFNSKWSKL